MQYFIISMFLLVGLVVVSLISMMVFYNALVRLRNHVKNAWSQIDVQLKRRHDLIPNLVETVKGYAAHEKDTLERVIQARNQAAGARGVPDQIEAEQQLGGALGKLMLVVEQYPDLQANQNFLSLQEELTSTENKIGFARQLYNDNVMVYNTKTESFPSNMVAGMFNFEKSVFFKITDVKEKQTPQVAF